VTRDHLGGRCDPLHIGHFYNHRNLFNKICKIYPTSFVASGRCRKHAIIILSTEKITISNRR
ncbi:uncharacterized protein METZ01_LOCUS419279, partial [marine metagenome]